MNHPVDLVPDWNEDSPNRYYIVDQGNKRVVITDEYGKYINEIKPIRDDDESLFERINGISVDNRGDIWVTDSGNQSIYKFSSIDAENSLELIGMIEDVLSKKSIKIREAVIPIMKFFTQINNKKVPIDPRAQIVDDRTMVPVRWLMENIYTQEEDDVLPIFAGDVQWDETTKKATLTLPKIDFGSRLVFESRVIELWQDNPTAKINGKPFLIDPENPNVTIKNIEDRLFVPLRFVSEAFDSKVSWTPKDEVPTSREGIVRISFPDYDYLDSKSADY